MAVTVNYRLGVFGFLAHPELTVNLPTTLRATMVCSTSTRPCGGCSKILRPSAAIPTGSRSPGSRPVGLRQRPDGLASIKGSDRRGHRREWLAHGTLSPVPLAKAEQAGVRFATKWERRRWRPLQDPGRIDPRVTARRASALPDRHRRLFPSRRSRWRSSPLASRPTCHYWWDGTPRR